MKKNTKAKLDRLATLLESIPPERIQAAICKTAMIVMRVTPAEKASMQQEATKAGCTLTDYLTRCHQVILAARSRKGI